MFNFWNSHGLSAGQIGLQNVSWKTSMLNGRTSNDRFRDVARPLSQSRQMTEFTFLLQNIQYLPHLDAICSRPANLVAGIACFCPNLATSLVRFEQLTNCTLTCTSSLSSNLVIDILKQIKLVFSPLVLIPTTNESQGLKTICYKI